MAKIVNADIGETSRLPNTAPRLLQVPQRLTFLPANDHKSVVRKSGDTAEDASVTENQPLAPFPLPSTSIFSVRYVHMAQPLRWVPKKSAIRCQPSIAASTR